MRERADPILVTGAHRSGTTWVGSILATAPSVTYVHEPFHIHHDRAICAAEFVHWFSYVSDENAAGYEDAVSDMFARTPGRPLVKDPIAIFSVEWLATRFRMRPVVLIRHPAAFALSLKARRWAHPFDHFLRQPLLMADHLDPFAREIMRFARVPQDILDQSALLWTLIYSVVLKYQERFPDWIYVRHEDLARDPVTGFQTLFRTLGLEFTDATARAIHDRRRFDLDGWRTELSPVDVERVRARVASVADHFYADEDWRLA